MRREEEITPEELAAWHELEIAEQAAEDAERAVESARRHLITVTNRALQERNRHLTLVPPPEDQQPLAAQNQACS